MPGKKRRGLQGQKWLTTSLSETVRSLTATVTALELDAQSLPATSDGFDIANDEDSIGDEHIADNKESLSTDEEFESEEAPVDDTTTVAQQAEMHFGRSNNMEEVSDNNNINNSKDADNVILSPMDCATLDVLKLCHDAGVSLEFYDILFALLRKHSSKNKVDIHLKTDLSHYALFLYDYAHNCTELYLIIYSLNLCHTIYLLLVAHSTTNLRNIF